MSLTKMNEGIDEALPWISEALGLEESCFVSYAERDERKEG